MGNVNEIKDELQGRTGLLSEFEEDLFDRISQAEDELDVHGSLVPTLKKVDLYFALALIALGIGLVFFSALAII
ncbi:MAG: hypothetical protein ACOYJU_03530 [Anaerovoracaceae bacterium]|jgi:hypothetical protein